MLSAACPSTPLRAVPLLACANAFGSPEASSGRIIVAEARTWIGTPFHWEASVKGVGCDCKGLIAGVARECGRAEGDSLEAALGGYSRQIDAGALAAGMARLFLAVLRDAPDGAPQDERFFDRLLPGDILLLAVGAHRQAVHLALFTGQDSMIHTYSKGPEMVIEVPLGRVWREAVVSAWRWKEVDHG